LPLVYNTGAYDSMKSMELMDGIVDIYMPDLKFLEPALSKKYLKTEDYPEAAKKIIKEMHRQVGVLQFDESGLALRGVLVRHLVMPGLLKETSKIMRFLGRQISKHTYVNIMDQYRPSGKIGSDQYNEINRTITPEEHSEAFQLAEVAGLYRFDKRQPKIDLIPI